MSFIPFKHAFLRVSSSPQQIETFLVYYSNEAHPSMFYVAPQLEYKLASIYVAHIKVHEPRIKFIDYSV